MSCIYKSAADSFFDKYSAYGLKDSSDIKRKISNLAENISKGFEEGNSVKNHMVAYIALGAATVAANEAGVPLNQAMALYAPAAADAVVHAYDYFVAPRVKAVKDRILTENPYAGKGLSPDQP